MVGNLALSLSSKAVALGFEIGCGVLCEHEAANMSIGGKELNLMVSNYFRYLFFYEEPNTNFLVLVSSSSSLHFQF